MLKEFTHFDQDQKQHLVGAWRRVSAQPSAARFVDAVEVCLRIQSTLCAGKESRLASRATSGAFRNVRHAAQKLIAAMSALGISGQYDLGLMLEYEAKDAADPYSRFLSDLNGVMGAAGVLEEARRLRTRRGPNKDFEYSILFVLVALHEQVFQRPPSASPSGSFAAFLDGLSSILGLALGRDLLKRVLLEERQFFRELAKNRCGIDQD